jgi:exodeoxyribonuclease X
VIIRTVDLETTGFLRSEGAGVCEIGWADVVSTAEDFTNAPTGWRIDNCGSALVNPGRPIPATASAIHHLIDEDVADAPPWEAFGRIVTPAGKPFDIYAAHTMKMERQWIDDDMTDGARWIDTWKCALRLWPDAPGHSNQCLRYWLRPRGLSRDHASGAHRAGPDAYVTAHLLIAQLNEQSIDALVQWSAEPAILIYVPFGQHRGSRWADMDDGFLSWVAVRDFDEEVLFTARWHLREREAAAVAAMPAQELDDDVEG